MNKLNSIILLSVLFFASAQAAYKGVYYQNCSPYQSGGQTRNGAFETCNNACYAVNKAGKPGRLTKGSGRVEDKGCSAGTGGRSPCTGTNSPYAGKPGNTCDEYPFAITEQGAASGKPAILRCVPGSDNSSGGAQLNNFFNSKGVGVGDTFDMAVDWATNNVPAFCGDANKANDGTEFKYSGGKLQNARRSSRDFLSRALVDADAETGTSSLVKLAKTKNGKTLLLLSGETPLGAPVWSDEDGAEEDFIESFLD